MKKANSRRLSLGLAAVMLLASMAMVVSAVGTTLAAPVDTFIINHAGTGISAIVQQDVLPAGTTLNVTPLTLSAPDADALRLGTWTIRFIYEGEEVQPYNGRVTIRMPISAEHAAAAQARIFLASVLPSALPQPSNVRLETAGDALAILFETSVGGPFEVSAIPQQGTTTAASTTTAAPTTTGMGETTTAAETTTGTETTTVDPSASSSQGETTTATGTTADTATTTVAGSSGGGGGGETTTTTQLLTGGKPPPPPQTGFATSTSAVVAAMILAAGGVYFGWRYFKRDDE